MTKNDNKLEYNWLEYKNMMHDAGFHYDKLKGFWCWVVYNAITDDQLLKLSEVLVKLAKGKENETANIQ